MDVLSRLANAGVVPVVVLDEVSHAAPLARAMQAGGVAVEDIQDSVETVLVQAGYADVAKAYILYRDQRQRARNDKKVMVDVESSINEYLEKSNISLKQKMESLQK